MSDTLVYCRNSIRLLGLLLFVLGFGLGLYQGISTLWTGTAPAWSLYGLLPVLRWLRHVPPLVQGFCGWPFVVLEVMPLPLVCLGGGLLAMRL